MGEDSPAPTAVFQRTFWLGPNSTGGLPSPIPEEFGPLNCGHSAAPAKLDRTTVATTMIPGVMTIYPPWRTGGIRGPSALDPIARKRLVARGQKSTRWRRRWGRLTYSHMGM